MLLIWMKRMKKKKRMKKIRNIEWEICVIFGKIWRFVWLFSLFFLGFAPQNKTCLEYVLFHFFTTPSSYNSFSFAFIHCLMKKTFKILKIWRYLLRLLFREYPIYLETNAFMNSLWVIRFWEWKIWDSISNLKDLMIFSPPLIMLFLFLWVENLFWIEISNNPNSPSNNQDDKHKKMKSYWKNCVIDLLLSFVLRFLG